jgi:hypothetical protein
MADFQGEVVRNAHGHAVVRLTTVSGARAVVSTCIAEEALDAYSARSRTPFRCDGGQHSAVMADTGPR